MKKKNRNGHSSEKQLATVLLLESPVKQPSIEIQSGVAIRSGSKGKSITRSSTITQATLPIPGIKELTAKRYKYTPPGSKNMVRGELGIMRPCGKLSDVPSKWVPQLKNENPLDIPRGAPRREVYRIALKALILEMRSKGSGMKRFIVENGKLIKVESKDNWYSFIFEGDRDLFEGATLQAEVNGEKSEGQIVSISGKTIVITVSKYFGDFIHEANLLIDNTAMLEALLKRYEDIAEKKDNLNFNIAEDVFSGKENIVAFDAQMMIVKNKYSNNQLNYKQTSVIAMALANNVTFLWGPPGTGKTQSLGALVEILFEMKKRVLICSNTNQAVDQVLLKLCKIFGKSSLALQDGKILRVGRIHHSELEDEYGDYVTIDGVVERKSVELIKEKKQLEEEIRSIRISLFEAQSIEEKFQLLNSEKSKILVLEKKLKKAEKQIFSNLKLIEELKLKKDNLNCELQKHQDSNALRRTLFSPEDSIHSDIVKVERMLSEHMVLIEKIKLKHAKLFLDIEVVKKSVLELNSALQHVDRNSIAAMLDEGNNKISPLSLLLSEICEKLSEVSKAVVDGAQVVGATVTKSYLSKQQFSNIDVVIIDEASMVLLPALYYVSGIAKEKVVVSGDFLQLSPIVNSSEKSVLDILGKDIFEISGISRAFLKGEVLPRAVMLNEQYRMSKKICSIISQWMYQGKLSTVSTTSHVVSVNPPPPFDQELMVVDTSALMPFVNRDMFKSRYNLMNSIVVRNVCRFLTECGYVGCGHGNVGICTPYAAQAKLLKRVVDGLGLSDLIDVGTVHRYQGDEKSSIIIDIPDSLGEYNVGTFLQSDRPEENGAKLFNVAVSRAKSQLIFVANLEYLNRRLPQNSFVRHILHTVQENGKVLDARDVLSLWPISDDLPDFGKHEPFYSEHVSSGKGLFNQQEFSSVFNVDLENARLSIAIFSGFFTSKRVASYGSVFMRKLQENVKIRCVTRPPIRNGSMDVDDGTMTLDSLESMGIVVDTRWNIHEKVVIIDDKIVWFGSLNPLSHTASTDELMMRINDEGLAKHIASSLAIKKFSEIGCEESISTRKENPACRQCGARATYRKGKYGPFWACEQVCGWKESVGINKGLLELRSGESQKNTKNSVVLTDELS